MWTNGLKTFCSDPRKQTDSLLFSTPSFQLQQTWDQCFRFKDLHFCLSSCGHNGLWVAVLGSVLHSPLCLPAVSPQNCSVKARSSTVWGSKGSSLCPVRSRHLRISAAEGRGRWKKLVMETYLPLPSQYFWKGEQQYLLPLSIIQIAAQCGLLKVLFILNLFLISLPLAPQPVKKVDSKQLTSNHEHSSFTNSSRLLYSNRNKTLLAYLMSALFSWCFSLCPENLKYKRKCTSAKKTIPLNLGTLFSAGKEVSCEVFCIIKVRSSQDAKGQNWDTWEMKVF